MARPTKKTIPIEVKAARTALKEKGYTYEIACEVLGYSYGHFAQVMTGDRKSMRVLKRIHALPTIEKSISDETISVKPRGQAAKLRVSLEETPYIAVAGEEGESLMRGAIKACRNYTKSQKAFIAVLFNEALLNDGPRRSEKSRTECVIKEVAANWGVDVRALEQAVELHRRIRAKASFAKEVEITIERELAPEVIEARKALKEKGYSYRSALGPLNCCYTTISWVLSGRRESASLLERIHKLPPLSKS